MANVTVYLPDDLAEAVREAAERDGRSVSGWLALVAQRALSGSQQQLPGLRSRRAPKPRRR